MKRSLKVEKIHERCNTLYLIIHDTQGRVAEAAAYTSNVSVLSTRGSLRV